MSVVPASSFCRYSGAQLFNPICGTYLQLLCRRSPRNFHWPQNTLRINTLRTVLLKNVVVSTRYRKVFPASTRMPICIPLILIKLLIFQHPHQKYVFTFLLLYLLASLGVSGSYSQMCTCSKLCFHYLFCYYTIFCIYIAPVYSCINKVFEKNM